MSAPDPAAGEAGASTGLPVEAPEHWRWRAGPVAPGPAVVFDLDGVLSDAAGRQHYLDKQPDGTLGNPRWREFFAACGDDPLITEVAVLLHLLDPALAVVLLTGRPLAVQPPTLAWLERYGLRWDLLVMRPGTAQSAAWRFKQQVVAELRAAGMGPVLAFEDDRRNAEMFRGEGVPCIYLHSGYFDPPGTP